MQLLLLLSVPGAVAGQVHALDFDGVVTCVGASSHNFHPSQFLVHVGHLLPGKPSHFDLELVPFKDGFG